jgi:glycosyltransferase involved in cell wall biosynthesis
VYVTDSYPPVLNGVSHVVGNLSKNMARLGHEVEVITVDNTFRLPRTEEKDGVVIKRFYGLSPGRSYHIPFPGIVDEIKKESDVLHVHNFHSVIPLASALSLNDHSSRIKVITPHYHVPGHHSHSKIAWKFYTPILKRVAKYFDVVQCVSQFEAQIIETEFGIKPIVIQNGINSDVYNYSWRKPPSENAVITFVGRLEKYKRIELLIQAAAIARRTFSNLQVVIVGTGPEAKTIGKLASQLDVNLEIRHDLGRNDLLDLYSNSSCVVNCSLFEAFSLVAAEALAIGTPVITVLPWGINFKDYPRAAIVEPVSEAIAKAIIQYEQLGSQPIKRVKTWEEIAQKYVEIYDAQTRMGSIEKSSSFHQGRHASIYRNKIHVT